MDLMTLAAFALAFSIAAASPGPGMAAVVARGLGGGFRSAFPMVLGLVLGDLVFLSLATFGLAALAQQFGTVFMVVKWAGAAYLLYLAVKLWRAEPGADDVEAAATQSFLRTMMAGFSLTLGNPKTIVFYLALLPTLVPLEHMSVLGFTELAALVTVLLTAIGSAYGAAAAGAREFFRSAVAQRRLNRTAGTIMAGAAAAIVAR